MNGYVHSISYHILQREELRARFPGVPGDLVNFFLYVAEEVIFMPVFPMLRDLFL